MINPQHLRTFLELCEVRHFTRAAENLHMTQPGVSQHLKALEKEFGVLLLQRKGKHIELTVPGEKLRRFARKRFQAEREFRENLLQDSPFAGDVRLACSGSNAVLLYPKLLDLQEMYPELRIILEAAPDTGSVNLVKQNKCDIGLITTSIDDPELDIRKLGTEQLSLILPRGSSSQWDDLLQLGFIDHPNGAHYATRVLGLNFPDHFTGMKTIPVTGYVNQLNQILLPVARRLGFTVLPESTVNCYADQNLIETGKLDTECRETIYLITKKYRTLPERYNRVIQTLESIWES
jgi:DNA-binding transcriptional LysR family regulator